jgi:hypothetical protein
MPDDDPATIEYITTSFVALDAKPVYTTADMTQDTCLKLGLAFFVPINKGRFEDMRNILRDRKSKWASYTGTVNDMVKQVSKKPPPNNATSDYYIAEYAKDTYSYWPYGPFGLYKAKSGDTADQGGKLLRTPKVGEDAAGLLSHYGWKTIFNPSEQIGQDIQGMFRNMKDLGSQAEISADWWIANKGCEYGGYKEPTGNYIAYTWLNYVADANGNIVHCDDSNNPVASGMAEYIYTHYTCVGLDSYFPWEGGNIAVNYDAWDSKLDPIRDDPALFTKVVGQNIVVKVMPKPDDNGATKGRICGEVIDKNYGWALGQACEDIPDDQDLRAEPLVLELGTASWASKEAYIKFTAYDCPIGGGACEEYESNSTDLFAIRPEKLGLDTGTPNPLRAGEEFNITTNVAGYVPGNNDLFPSGSFKDELNGTTGFVEGSLTTTVYVQLGGSIYPRDSITLAQLKANKPTKTFVETAYTEVGSLKFTYADDLWASVDSGAVSNFASLGMNGAAHCIIGSYNHVADPITGLIGCNVGMDATLGFVPFNFEITTFTLDNNDSAAFTFYSSPASATDPSYAAANALINIEARNKSGDVTKNYAKGLYSQDIEVYDLSWSYQQLRNGSGLVSDSSNLVVGGETYVHWGLDDNISKDLWPVGGSDQGTLALTREFNFNRLYTKTMHPISLANVGLKIKENGRGREVNHSEAPNRKTSDSSDAVFVYGKIYAPSVSTTTDMINVPRRIAFYCPDCNKFSTGVPVGVSADVRDWRLFDEALTGYPIVGVGLYSAATGGGASDTNNSNSAVFMYGGNERPKSYVVHLGNPMPGYLWYHQFATDWRRDVVSVGNRSECYMHPCTTIEFLPVGQNWGGTGNSDEGDRRAYDDNTTRARSPQRLNW